MAIPQTKTVPTSHPQAAAQSAPANVPSASVAAIPRHLGMCCFYREDQFPSGVYSFSENLMRGFAELAKSNASSSPFELVVFHGATRPRWLNDQLKYQRVDCRNRTIGETKVGFHNSSGFDAVLFPNTFTPPVIRARRAVTVIHDLQYAHFSEYWPWTKRIWMRISHEVTLRKCDAVVAISQVVKDDILERYGARWESRVHAIWNPVAIDRFDGAAEQSFTNGRPYIMSTAVDRPVKNLSTLIRAFGLLRGEFPDHCLVLAGQLRTDDRTWRRRTTRLEQKMPSTVDVIQQLGLDEHVITTGYVPDQQLGALYRGASVFVLPSLFEGFGMPAVEALALGAPTLVSNLPVLREVTLNRAQYLTDPLDEHQMADQIAQILVRGNAARPAPDVCCDMRRRFAPETIAKQYLRLLLDDQSC